MIDIAPVYPTTIIIWLCVSRNLEIKHVNNTVITFPQNRNKLFYFPMYFTQRKNILRILRTLELEIIYLQFRNDII